MALPALAIGGIAAGAGSLIDAFGRSYDVKREIEARKKEAELAYQRSVEMWYMQNAYNSPEEQMKRFGAAGLNPHLIYGQGSAGNANQGPQYQPPQIQMQGATPPYGTVISTALQDLMAVGTWMQNMKMSEVEIERRKTDVEKMQEMVEFLKAKYPHEIRKFDQLESLWPYQKDAQESGMYKARVDVSRMLEEFRHLYGRELDVGAPYKRVGPEGEGMRALQRRVEAESGRLRGLQADWLDPDAIYSKMIMGGVLGMLFRRGAGKSGSKNLRERITETTKTKRVGRETTHKREWYAKPKK